MSLLGPLTTTLCLMTGARVFAKGGSGSENLTAALRDEILNGEAGPILTQLWAENLTTEQFDRHDPRNAEWSAMAQARIVFGSGTAAAAIEALPHQTGTPFFAFGDPSSLIFAEPAALDDAALKTVLRVFQIYGKTGCTSQQSLVLIDGTTEQAVQVADRLKTLSDEQTTPLPPVHIASDSFMEEQVARARGWHGARSRNGQSVFVSGCDATDELPGLVSLRILPQTLKDAIAALPSNIQSVGYVADNANLRTWARVLSDSRALRLVPIREMHHFGPFWDGQAFWRGLFREMDIRSGFGGA